MNMKLLESLLGLCGVIVLQILILVLVHSSHVLMKRCAVSMSMTLSVLHVAVPIIGILESSVNVSTVLCFN